MKTSTGDVVGGGVVAGISYNMVGGAGSPRAL